MLKYKFLGQVWTPREIAEFMLDKINLDFPNLRILEPACGEGIFLEVLVNRLKGRSYEIHCVDIDKKALEIAQRKFYNNPNIKFFYMDFLKKFKGFGYD
ncbi:MAG: methyltransferase domain-containing protein, partial [candidate division WOR-3 bacterium]